MPNHCLLSDPANFSLLPFLLLNDGPEKNEILKKKKLANSLEGVSLLTQALRPPDKNAIK